ncbi:MAG: polyprenyl synthetase family protein [Bacteriovoracaceae bacterium]|nr:polyprenyl synthetase family protein [Bacteriovoracaceae bacterium]
MNSLIDSDFRFAARFATACGPDEFLGEVSRIIEESIKRNSEGRLRTMALKHFESKGKMLRPMFIRDLALSMNLDLALVLPWAVTCEILHNATLIHDDLQDGDEIRRGRPTAWREYGPEQAINLGDFLLIIAPQELIKSNLSSKNELLHLFTVMSSRVVAGQVDEFELNKLQSHHNLHQQYLDCIAGKTSSLFAGLAIGVGIIAGVSKEFIHSLENIFFQLGHIFQIQDDILDFYGNKQRGERGCDIKEGKVSFLVVNYLERNPGDFDILARILRKKRADTDENDFQIIEKLFNESHHLEFCLNHLEQRVDDLRSHSLFEGNRILFRLVNSLIEKILAPIRERSRVSEKMSFAGEITK